MDYSDKSFLWGYYYTLVFYGGWIYGTSTGTYNWNNTADGMIYMYALRAILKRLAGLEYLALTDEEYFELYSNQLVDAW